VGTATSRRLLPEGLVVADLAAEPDGLRIRAMTETAHARCPVCGRDSRRVHSRYGRTVADLPWRGLAVKLEVRARKFFCDRSSCERKVFCERLPDVAARARKTGRLEKALLAVVLELGGRAGSRLAAELGLLVGRDALLERIKSNYRVATENIKVLGIDDFGFKRGNASGTIMVDLERHEVVDLLQGHSTQLIARWLSQQPNLEVVARDRSNVCQEGIDAGAPQARQVADRWHLLHNLTQVLETFLLTKRPELKKAAMPETGSEANEDHGNGEDSAPTTEIPDKRPYEHIEGPARERHERLVEQWKEIRRLHLAGAKVKDISEWTGTSRSTVYRYRQLAEPPPRPVYKKKASVLDPWMPYLIKRWNEGCHSTKKLYYEIREQGYSHSIDTVNRVTSDFRYTEEQGKKLRAPKAKKNSIAGASPTARNVAALFMRREEKLDKEQKEYLDRLCASDEALADAHRLVQEFAKMVRQLEGEKLDGWLAEAASSEAEVMSKFAAGLEKDLSAVRAGLTERWSTGPVEGFIHKVKLIKRQGYGRADFELLRARVLAA
jgi:transposase